MTQLDVPNRQTTPTQHTRVLGSSFRCLDKEGKRPQNHCLQKVTRLKWNAAADKGLDAAGAAGFFNLVAVLRGSADLVFPALRAPRHANQGMWEAHYFSRGGG
eukprot:scaffold22547_cov89-Phaeocystis_antarctica.AAC.3